jgi:phage host-nuclease inhibitor protein Gam
MSTTATETMMIKKSERTLKEATDEYIPAIEPLVKELTKLKGLVTKITYYPKTGEIKREYSPEVLELKNKYKELIEEIRKAFAIRRDG